MAVNLLKHKRSAVPNKAPAIGDLTLGELAINTFDGCIYLKRIRDSSEEVVKISSDPVSATSDAIITTDTFTGDGTTVAYTLTTAPVGDEHSFVTINGVDQHINSYSVSGKILTFSEAPINGDAIEVRTLSITPDSVKVRDYKTHVYQPSAPISSFSGSDINGNTLVYDIGKIEVYLNGVRLVNGLDYTANNGTAVTLVEGITSGNTLEVVSLSKASFADHAAIKPNESKLVDTTAGQIIDTFPAESFRTAKYIISISHETAGYHSEEILLLHDDTDVYITTYAQIFTNQPLTTISSTIVGGIVQLTATPVNTNTIIKLQRISVTKAVFTVNQSAGGEIEDLNQGSGIEDLNQGSGTVDLNA